MEEENTINENSKEQIKEKSSSKFLKFNTKITILGIIIIVGLVAFLIYSIFYSEKGRIIIEAKSTQEKVVDKNELRTVTYTYNGIAKKCKEEC